MTPTERATLRRQAERYAKGPAGTPEHRNLQAILADAVPDLLDEIDLHEQRRVPVPSQKEDWP